MLEHDHYLYLTERFKQKQKSFNELEKYRKQNEKIYNVVIGLREFKKRDYKIKL